MQVGEQIVDLLVIEHIAEAFHFVAAHANHVLNAIIVGRHSADRKVCFLEKSPQTRALPLPRRVRGMAAIAILIIDMPPGRLSGRES